MPHGKGLFMLSSQRSKIGDVLEIADKKKDWIYSRPVSEIADKTELTDQKSDRRCRPEQTHYT